MTCGMIFATGCSKAPKCKQALDSVLTAESFTVSVDDDVVIFKGYGADKKDVEVRVTDINKTKIIIPAEVTGGAKPVNNISLS